MDQLSEIIERRAEAMVKEAEESVQAKADERIKEMEKRALEIAETHIEQLTESIFNAMNKKFQEKMEKLAEEMEKKIEEEAAKLAIQRLSEKGKLPAVVSIAEPAASEPVPLGLTETNETTPRVPGWFRPMKTVIIPSPRVLLPSVSPPAPPSTPSSGAERLPVSSPSRVRKSVERLSLSFNRRKYRRVTGNLLMPDVPEENKRYVTTKSNGNKIFHILGTNIRESRGSNGVYQYRVGECEICKRGFPLNLLVAHKKKGTCKSRTGEKEKETEEEEEEEEEEALDSDQELQTDEGELLEAPKKS